MKTRGRPCKDGSKKCRFEIRIDERNRDMLDFLAEKTGKTKTEIMMNGLRMYYNLEKYRD